MIRTDFILELIEQCAAMILAALGHKDAQEADQKLSSAVLTWTGLDLNIASRLPTQTLVQLLGAQNAGSEERMMLVGHALAHRCLMKRHGGAMQEALVLQEKAVALIEEALRRQPKLEGTRTQAILTALYS